MNNRETPNRPVQPTSFRSINDRQLSDPIMKLRRWQILTGAYCCFIAALILPVMRAGWLDGTTDLPGMYMGLYSLCAFGGGIIVLFGHPSYAMLISVLYKTSFLWGLLIILIIVSPTAIYFYRRMNSQIKFILSCLTVIYFIFMWLSPLFQKNLSPSPFCYSGYWALGCSLILLSSAYFYKEDNKSKPTDSTNPPSV